MRIVTVKQSPGLLSLVLDDGRAVSVPDEDGSGWTARDYYRGKEVALNADGSLAFIRN